MNEAKHTPGPWEYRVAANYVGFSIAPVNTVVTLAAVERPRGNPETLNVTCFNFPGDTEANARLIAAAPDLLEACKAALNDMECDDFASETLTKMIRDAIAKAKGEAVAQP
jgi:hypothetical protein